MSYENENIVLAKIETEAQWQAYKKLFEEENRRRGIKGQPLPDKRPQRSAAAELDLTIQRFFDLWERDKPLQQVKDTFVENKEQLQENADYYYQQARFCLENTFSGIVGTVEETLGLSATNSTKVDYFVEAEEAFDLKDAETPCIEKEDQAEQSTKADSVQSVWGRLHHSVQQSLVATSSAIEQVATKGIEDIKTTERAICGWLNYFKGR